MFASTDIREHLASEAMCSFTGQDYGDALESLSLQMGEVEADDPEMYTSVVETELEQNGYALTSQYDVELIASAIEAKDIQCRMISTYLDDSGNTVHVYESLQDARTNLARAIVAELLSRVNN
jgi:hypothetical protein